MDICFKYNKCDVKLKLKKQQNTKQNKKILRFAYKLFRVSEYELFDNLKKKL